MRALKIRILHRLLARLAGDTSGNALLLMALGLPMLIGGAGFAVDFSQWYMWKRELQYAVDQAAIAGAWARSDTSTQTGYADRARQEYNANLSATKNIASVPVIGLANYAGGANNSVTVNAHATKALPFSSLFISGATTIDVHAQAAWDEGKTFTSCLIAVDPDDDGAITIGGSSILTANCGLAALSTSANAITVNGNPTVDAGWILAAGGIDDWFNTHTDDTILENMTGLYDPFAKLSPPNPTESQVSRTYNCVKGTKTTYSNKSNSTTTTYTYWKGQDYNTAVQTNYNKAKNPNTTTSSAVYTLVSNTTVDGTVVTTTVTWSQVNGTTGPNTMWEKKTVVSSDTYSGTKSTSTPDQANVLPGTYSGGIKIGCQTVFAPGVYILDGGGLQIDGNYTVTGAGVMFVLKNSGYVQINGGTNISLTAMQASDLIARGVSADDATKLAGMLVFEDRNSSGSSKDIINGNAQTVLNGTVYLPKSNIDFSGTATVTSQCLMIASATINITGNANMSTFCPAGSTEDTVVATVVSKVKLVA